MRLAWTKLLWPAIIALALVALASELLVIAAPGRVVELAGAALDPTALPTAAPSLEPAGVEPTTTPTVVPPTATTSPTATSIPPTATVVPPTPTSTATPTPTLCGACPAISVGSTSIGPSGERSVDVRAHNIAAPGLGAWTIDVTYDAAVVTVAGCSAQQGGICNAAFGPHVVRIVGSNAAGVAGTSTLGSIRFSCDQLGVSALTPAAPIFADATVGHPQNIDEAVQAGSVMCKAEEPPTDTPTSTFTPTNTSMGGPAATPTRTPTLPAQPVATNTPPARPTRVNVIALPPAPPAPAAPVPEPGGGGGAQASPPQQQPPAQQQQQAAPTSAPTSRPLSTPARLPTNAAPTAVAPTPLAQPTSVVAGAVDEPPADGGSEEPAQAGPPAGVVPSVTRNVPTPGQLSTSAGVVATNIVLALILLLVLLVTSELFNDTMTENREDIEEFAGRVGGPFLWLGNLWAAGQQSIGISPRLARLIGPAVVLLLTAVIYTLQEPGVTLDSQGLLLFLSLLISMGVLTYVYEGGEVLMTERGYHVRAGVQMVPFAIALAVSFVMISRVTDFQAPVLYGFVVAATVLGGAWALDERQSGIAVAVPAVALFTISLAAWALIGPLRDLAGASNDWYAHLPSETAALIFAGGMEGLLFTMTPLAFQNGGKIYRWNRAAWAAIFGSAAFVFSWALLNPAAQQFDALVERRVVIAMSLVAAYAVTVVVTWWYFVQRERAAHAAAPAPAGDRGFEPALQPLPTNGPGDGA